MQPVPHDFVGYLITEKGSDPPRAAVTKVASWPIIRMVTYKATAMAYADRDGLGWAEVTYGEAVEQARQLKACMMYDGQRQAKDDYSTDSARATSADGGEGNG